MADTSVLWQYLDEAEEWLHIVCVTCIHQVPFNNACLSFFVFLFFKNEFQKLLRIYNIKDKNSMLSMCNITFKKSIDPILICISYFTLFIKLWNKLSSNMKLLRLRAKCGHAPNVFYWLLVRKDQWYVESGTESPQTLYISWHTARL